MLLSHRPLPGAEPMAEHETAPGRAMTRTIELPGEAASITFATSLAMILRPADLILLQGNLGAGKTTIARALVRAVANDPELEVPSPTFTLVQPYDLPGLAISHMDFYRLEDPHEVAELGLDDALENGAVIIEWPERVEAMLPAGGLVIRLAEQGEGRIAHVTAPDAGWLERLDRMAAVDRFLEQAGWASARRIRIPGDASSRRYERLVGGPEGASGLLMDMPARPDGPPVRDGKPYSRIANLAEDIRAVEAVTAGLLAQGLSAPRIYAIDLTNGLVVIEDFGSASFNSFVRDGMDISEQLTAAVELLAEMAVRDWPHAAALSDGSQYEFAPYDRDALMIEAELCLDWYWPYLTGGSPGEGVRAGFIAAWDEVLPLAVADVPVWVLRDFHVDNLFWLPEREGGARVGLIDTQDCVLGNPAYDLASLLLDVRVTFPKQVSDDYLDVYCALRGATEDGFDESSFRQAYAVLGAQRATKILGIFARLAKRDGKPGYLRFLPRTSEVLEICLRHPALRPVRLWFEQHLPARMRDRGPA
jgi:tRNA threonylcarbamoyl adenosine modification protein YjeE